MARPTKKTKLLNEFKEVLSIAQIDPNKYNYPERLKIEEAVAEAKTRLDALKAEIEKTVFKKTKIDYINELNGLNVLSRKMVLVNLNIILDFLTNKVMLEHQATPGKRIQIAEQHLKRVNEGLIFLAQKYDIPQHHIELIPIKESTLTVVASEIELKQYLMGKIKEYCSSFWQALIEKMALAAFFDLAFDAMQKEFPSKIIVFNRFDYVSKLNLDKKTINKKAKV